MRPPLRARLLTAFAGLALSLGCVRASAGPSRTASPWHVAPSVADTIRTERLIDGVLLHRLVWNAAPWRAYALDIDLTACLTVRSVKGAAVAEGRKTVSALMLGMQPTFDPIAAVNADFFLFVPPGVPVGPHIEDGIVVSGPVARPAFAMLADGKPWTGTFILRGSVTSQRGTLALTNWNRPASRSAGIVDSHWGVPLDSTITGPLWRLVPVATSTRYIAELWPPGIVRVARGDTLLLVGAASDASGIAATVQPGDTVTVERDALPVAMRFAVGGFPMLLRDSMIVGAVDSVSNAGFRGVNPRTAVGFGAGGRRLILMVVDGRQATHSAGMSLRETANALRNLGARDAINLDGGGSSALVLRDAAAPGGFRVANKPSDAGGERAVANALAVVRGCSH